MEDQSEIKDSSSNRNSTFFSRISHFQISNTLNTIKIHPRIPFYPRHTEFSEKSNRMELYKKNRKNHWKFMKYFGIFGIGLILPMLIILFGWSVNFFKISFSEECFQFQKVNQRSFKSSKNDVKCESKICIQAVSRLLRRINSSEDPCENFYEFSCGNFIAKNEVPDDGFQRSTLQEMHETLLVEIKKLIDQPSSPLENSGIRKARQLYSSCMNENFRTSHYADYNMLPIFNVLKEDKVGNWPILQGHSWNISEYSLERLLSQLFVHQVQNVLKLYVSPDETDPTKYMLEFYKGDPGMTTSFFLNSSEPDYVKYLRSYRRLLLESVLLLTHAKQGSPAVASDVEAILQFETKFAKVVETSKCHLDGHDFDNVEHDYGHLTIREITFKLPQIKWKDLIQNLFDTLGLKRKVTENMVLYFHCSEFYPKLFSLLEQTDKRTLTNYLIWRFVFRHMPFLGNKFLLIWMEFMKDVPDTNEERLHLSRWKQCASIVNDGFGFALASLYIEKSFKSETIFKVREMVFYLKKAFENVINEQEWLSNHFKEDLVEKLKMMGEKVGYPSYILDSNALEKEYDGLEIDEPFFLMNILKLRRFEVLKEIRRVNQQVDKERDWIILPLVANAFHNPVANEIVIPLGILRYPMYSDHYPMYLNFANLGIVIGHEMTHGFDHQGRFYDKNGNYSHWWPDEVVHAFRKQAICFTKQYSKFSMPIIGHNVDGNTTLSDNVCDNAALRLSWLAYELWTKDHGVENGLPGIEYTIPQIFYISYAQIWCEVLNKEGYEQYIRDPHSPGEFRTKGVAQNNRYFGKFFECPLHTQMNPKDKCILWS